MLPVPIDHVVEKLGEQPPTRMGEILWAAERPQQTHVLNFFNQQSGVSGPTRRLLPLCKKRVYKTESQP